MAETVLVGTSGYSYDDWRGVFYPHDLAGGDMLAYYAREFSFTEVNATFYRIPGPRMFERLATATPAEFVFTVKAHGSLTHERGEAVKGSALKFRVALQPLRDAEKLGAVLFQFPYSFRNNGENRAYLARLRDAFAGVPAAVEFRHASWVEGAIWEFLRALDLAYVCVDEPRLRGLVGPVAVRTAGFGYVRFHGRNAAKWWHHAEAWERYDYLYSKEELVEWAPQLKSLADGADRVFVAFNNHPRGQAVQNARLLREILARWPFAGNGPG